MFAATGHARRNCTCRTQLTPRRTLALRPSKTHLTSVGATMHVIPGSETSASVTDQRLDDRNVIFGSPHRRLI